MPNSIQSGSTSTFNALTQAIQEYGTSETQNPATERRILKLARAVDPTAVQHHLAEITNFTVQVAANFHARKSGPQTTKLDQEVARYDRLRYLIDTEIEKLSQVLAQIQKVEQLLNHLQQPETPAPQLTKRTATACTNAIYGEFGTKEHQLVDALTANTEPNSKRSIILKDTATLTCSNDNGQCQYTLTPLEGKGPELSDILHDVRLSLGDQLTYDSIFDPARYFIEPNTNHNRAHESRTESEATSMATTIDAVVDAPETTSKRTRRASKTKEEPSAPAPEATSNDKASSTPEMEAEEQRHLAAMEKESGAPAKGSYLREAAGYDALSPEQKAACDKDFQGHLEKRTQPIEQREGESKEDAMLRATKEYCSSRQEHTARHGKIAQVMLKSKINCLNTDRVSFSLMNPDVAKEFLATAFYHHSSAAKGVKSFDKDLFAKCKTAAQREFAAFASSVETGASGTKDFNNSFVLGVQRPPIGSPTQNLRIAVSPLPGKRDDLASIFGKCAFYHSNRSGRTPEERDQRRVARTKPLSELAR